MQSASIQNVNSSMHTGTRCGRLLHAPVHRQTHWNGSRTSHANIEGRELPEEMKRAGCSTHKGRERRRHRVQTDTDGPTKSQCHMSDATFTCKRNRRCPCRSEQGELNVTAHGPDRIFARLMELPIRARGACPHGLRADVEAANRHTAGGSRAAMSTPGRSTRACCVRHAGVHPGSFRRAR